MFLSSNLFFSCLRRLAQLPTAVHLFCAEQELRNANTLSMSAAIIESRERNLRLLREYRLRWEFPHNEHEPRCFSPCFVDAAGRQCAVAYLMHETGAKEVLPLIAQKANYARIHEMHFPELEDWVRSTGLTKAELARIQPTYAPTTPEEIAWASRFDMIVRVYGVFVLFGVLSIVQNCSRHLWINMRRLIGIIVGFLSGVFLLCYRIAPM